MDNVNISVTGRLGDAPAQGTTSNGKPWTSFSFAAEVPGRIVDGQREYETRWYKVWTYGPLAEHLANSLVKGDRVTVRADDVTCRAWTEDGPERRPRAQVELRAYDVSESFRFDSHVTAKAARQSGAPADSSAAVTDPWADNSQANQAREVPEVLAGVTR